MSRLNTLTEAHLDDQQRGLFDAIMGGKRAARSPKLGSLLLPDGGLIGPFNPWLHHPALGHPAQDLGEVLRFDGVLEPPLRELAILTVGAEWRSQFEWWAHRRIALDAGLSESIIDGIKQGNLPEEATPAQQCVHRFARELLDSRRVSDSTYDEALALLGEKGVIELVTLMGYYVIVSMTLNAFEVGLPEGAELPFADRP